MDDNYPFQKGKTAVGFSLNLAGLRNWLLVAALVFGVLFSGFAGQTTAYAQSNYTNKAIAFGQTNHGPITSAIPVSPSVTFALTGPSMVSQGAGATFNFKITNSDPISYFAILGDVYPTELTYSGPVSITDNTSYACIAEPFTPPTIQAPGMAQIDESDVGGIIYCYMIIQPNSTVSFNAPFTATGPASSCFLSQGVMEFADYQYASGPGLLPGANFKDIQKAIQTDSYPIYFLESNAATCIAASTPKPPADLVAQLRVNPDSTVLIDPNSEINYSLMVKNIGIGEANRTTVTVPFDGNLDVGYLTSEDPNVWVSAINTNSEPHTVTLSLPTIQSGGSYTANLVMRPSAAAVPGSVEVTRFTVKWDDAERTGKTAGSNSVSYTLSDSTENVNGDSTQMFDPATATVKNGDEQTFNANFFAPGELVTVWYTAPDNTTSTELGTVLADENGAISVTFIPKDLTVGATYSLSAHGNRSDVYASATVTIGS